MSKTQIAEYIGKIDSDYGYLALPSERMKSHIEALLEEIGRGVGDGLYLMPRDALHITLCEILQSRVYSQNKQSLYDAGKVAFENIPAQIFERFPPIHARFTKIEVSPHAIIIRGEDDGSFNEIRRQLVEKLPLPVETKSPPDIIHISIARFTKEMDLEPIKKVVECCAFNEEETISEFKLVNTTVLPFDRYQTIRTYPLMDSVT